ncbi:MAG: DUF2235 domain-containing protein [Hyphomicrobiaceae bacterium]
MVDAVTRARKEIRAQLGVKRGSRAVPFLLMALMIVIFLLSLPSGEDQLSQNLGVDKSRITTLLQEGGEEKAKLKDLEKLAKDVFAKTNEFGFSDYLFKVGFPVLKSFMDSVVFGIKDIVLGLASTVWQIGLFALIPGIAGLIYRRNFLVWFAVSFALMFGLNASGVFGQLAPTNEMPFAGVLLQFLFVQLIFLVLVNRLSRHTTAAGFMRPWIHNALLIAVLLGTAVACVFGFGPGWHPAKPAVYEVVDVSTAPTPNADKQPIALSSGATDPAAGAAPAATQPQVPPSAPPATPPVTKKVKKVVKPAEPVQRSWIWSFLGTGVSGWIYKWEFLLLGLPTLYFLLRNSARWTGRKRKNIVVCLDGTSNTPDQQELGLLAQTNVFKLFKMLKSDKRGSFEPAGKFDASLCKTYEDKQIAFYYAGVGNQFDNDPIAQTLGMAAGMGASGIVERAYLDIMRVYRPEDRIFIFGFSRGAAIARLLARAIDERGAPKTVWTLRLFGRFWTVWKSYARQHDVPVKVLGCWDTVGSFGIAKTIAGINFQQLNLFKDLTVPETVERAYHMVALDEMRDSFEPTLMDPDPIRPERIVEVWFSGDHANIGGGWATDRLSDVTMDFLLRRISSGYADRPGKMPGDPSWGLYLTAANGLDEHAKEIPATVFKNYEDASVIHPDPSGQLRSWYSALYEYRPRKLPLHAVISDTVFQRMVRTTPVYAPQALFNLNKSLHDERVAITREVTRLKATGSLSVDERGKVLEYKDRLHLTRWHDYEANLNDLRNPPTPAVLLENEEGDGMRRSPASGAYAISRPEQRQPLPEMPLRPPTQDPRSLALSSERPIS